MKKNFKPLSNHVYDGPAFRWEGYKEENDMNEALNLVKNLAKDSATLSDQIADILDGKDLLMVIITLSALLRIAIDEKMDKMDEEGKHNLMSIVIEILELKQECKLH